MVMICPYCDIEINEKLVEAEDGCCPECGALITASTVITEDDDEYFDGEDGELGEDDDESFDEGVGGSDNFSGYDDLGGEDFKDDDY